MDLEPLRRNDVEERILKLREHVLDTVPEICSERAVLITQAYKEYEGSSFVLKKAYALKKILSEMTIYIEESQRIAGNQAGKMRAAPIFPEYSVDWVEAEMDGFHERTGDVFQIDEVTKKNLRKIIPYWKGRTHEDQVLESLPSTVKKSLGFGSNITRGDYPYWRRTSHS